MIPRASSLTLTDSQRAAVAKLACCLARPGGIGLLCGPRGVGTTTVLRHVAAVLSPRQVQAEQGDAAAWEAWLATSDAVPDVILVDDAHLAADGVIARLVSRCQGRRPAAGMVLAGEGRLLSLVARDSRVEAAIGMRVVLRTASLDESRRIIAGVVPRSATDERLIATVHEIAAGIPAATLRLAELAAVLAASRPDGIVTADDIETIHRRLSPQAA